MMDFFKLLLSNELMFDGSISHNSSVVTIATYVVPVSLEPIMLNKKFR